MRTELKDREKRDVSVLILFQYIIALRIQQRSHKIVLTIVNLFNDYRF